MKACNDSGIFPWTSDGELKIHRRAEQVFGKVTEELSELREAIGQGKDRVDEEFGDLMFSMINLSRFLGLNAENSLTNATNKFINRCVGIELLAREREKKLSQMSAEEIDALWQSIK
ncbi:MAG: MazG nucleotide pyrophosphohydrolase domain-containing protein [Lachnospiraceae bacterium]